MRFCPQNPQNWLLTSLTLAPEQLNCLDHDNQYGCCLFMSDDFRIAVERARDRVGENVWRGMSLHDQADAIYQELRDIDAERFVRQPPHRTGGG
jgi:hypothetical protein